MICRTGDGRNVCRLRRFCHLRPLECSCPACVGVSVVKRPALQMLPDGDEVAKALVLPIHNIEEKSSSRQEDLLIKKCIVSLS